MRHYKVVLGINPDLKEKVKPLLLTLFIFKIFFNFFDEN